MNISIKDMTLVSLFAGLTAIGAAISIPLGEVPITMQTLFVILSGLILGPKLGALSQLVYIFLGLIGMPIFSNFTGGLQSIMKPSFGFVIGFVFASYLAGSIVHSKISPSKLRILMGSILASLIIYFFGLPYMYYILNITMKEMVSFQSVIYMGFLIFLPGDILKLLIASFTANKLLPILKSNSLAL